MKKPPGKLEVVARRAHCDREHLPTDPDLEGFLNSQIVEDAPVLSIIPLDNFGRLDSLRGMSHNSGIS